MGVLDSLGRLLGGAGKAPLPLVLAPGEQELARVVASARPGQPNSVGGDLVLTNQRCAFCPLNTKDLVEVLSWGLGKAGSPAGARVVRGLGGQVNAAAAEHGLGNIAEVRIGSSAGTLKPPTLLLVSAEGVAVEIGILSGRLSRNGSRSNETVRDQMAMAIATAINRA